MSLFQIINSCVTGNLNRAAIVEHRSHHLFVKNINANSRVIDLGANMGLFFTAMVERYNCFCYAVEASPGLFDELPAYPKVMRYNYAITNRNGPVRFHLSANPEAGSLNVAIAEKWESAGSITVPGKTFGSFLEESKLVLPVDILKIDIEGAEVDIFENLEEDVLAGFRQIAIEFHDFILTDSGYKLRMYNAISRLKKHYHVIKISSYDWREVICIHRRLNRLSLLQKVRLKGIHPFLLSLKHVHTGVSKLYRK